MRTDFRKLLLGLLIIPNVAFGLGNNNPTGTTGEFNGSVTTGGSYDPYTGNARRVVDDIVVSGGVGTYPLAWHRTLLTRDTSTGFGSSGHWRHSYDWNIRAPAGTAGTVVYPDGRTLEGDGPNYGVGDRLTGQHYDAGWNMDYARLLLADGGTVEFTLWGFYNIYGQWTAALLATYITDPYGARTTLQYNSDGMLDQVTEPGGRYLKIFYTTDPWEHFGHDPSQPYIKVISRVEAHTGYTGGHADYVAQAVDYSYAAFNGSPSSGYTSLANVSYSDGTHASYTYQQSNTVATPAQGGYHYGVPLIATCDDVRYAGAMRKIAYEFLDTSFAENHGVIYREKSGTTGETVSRLDTPTNPNQDVGSRDEIRGDGPQRHFSYNHDYGWLDSVTDFRNQTTRLYYGEHGANDGFLWYVDDAKLRRTVYNRETQIGAIKQITYAAGTSDEAHEWFEYDDANDPYYLLWKTDSNGAYANDPAHTTSYTRDPHHRVKHISYPDGGSEDFDYWPDHDANFPGELKTHSRKKNASETEVESFTYDARGLKLSWTDAAGGITHYHYDVNDHLEWSTDPRGSGPNDPNHTTRYWHNQRGQLTFVQYPPVPGEYTGGAMSRIDYDDYGNKIASWDELAHKTTYVYDEYNRITATTDPLGTYAGDPSHSVTNSYLQPGQTSSYVSTVSQPAVVTLPSGRATKYYYDANWRTQRVQQAPGTSDEANTYSDYDEVGNLTYVTDPRGQWPADPAHTTTYGYDARNRRTMTTNALGEVTRVFYDRAGNKRFEVRPTGSWTEWHEGWAVPPADGTWREWQYDAMNRVSETYGFAREHTGYQHDFIGNVTVMIDAKNAVYSFQYDSMNRKALESYPVDATGSYRNEIWQYDAAGNLLRYQTPNGEWKHLRYDNRNRAEHSLWNRSQSDLDPADRTVGPETATLYDAASRVTSVQTPETCLNFGYDDANRKTTEDFLLLGYPWRHIEHAPDADGNPGELGVTTNGNLDFLVYYDYTQRHQLWHIRQADNSGLYTYTYDRAGNMTKRQGAVLGDSINVQPDWYDALNRPTIWQNSGTADAAYAWSHYKYDSVGREVATWRDEDNGLGSGRGERFDFEVTDQLKQAWYNALNVSTGSPVNQTKYMQYNYSADKLNRVTVQENNFTATYSRTDVNQYGAINGSANSFDGRFNLTGTGYNGATYTFNAANQLISATKSGNTGSFLYDGLGRCVQRTINGVTRLFVYDGWKPVLEYDGAGNFFGRRVYGPGPDEILMRGDGYGWYFYHTDKQGSITSLLDINGNVVERYSYDAFGKPTITSWWDDTDRGSSWYGNRFTFTGREWFPELGIYDYRNRFYQPELGRFLQADPKGFDAGDMNLFRYCGDDPVDRTDPDGLWSPEAHDALFDHALQTVLPAAELAHVKEVSRELDRMTGLPPVYSHMHGMRQASQSPAGAAKLTEQFIRHQLRIARAAANHHERVKALTEFAKAAHTLQDTLSPAHRTTSGEPKIWNPGNISRIGRTTEHSPSDKVPLGIERTRNITPEIYKESDDAIRSAYDSVFRKNN